jgi:hypothetical protein
LYSFVRFPGPALRRELRLATERLGRCYRLCDGHSYRVFRETVRPLPDRRRAVIEVGFRLKLIRSAAAPHWLFERLCILTTPFWSGFDGFATKLWMLEPHTRSYAGIYEWADDDAARAYLDVLLPVLRVVSVSGSVFCKLHPDTELEDFLPGRRAGLQRDPHPCIPGAPLAAGHDPGCEEHPPATGPKAMNA